MDALNRTLKKMLSKANQYYIDRKLSQAIVAYEFITVVLEEESYRGKYVAEKSIVYIRLAKIYLESKEFEKSLNTYQLLIKGIEEEITGENNPVDKLPLSVLKELENLGITYMLHTCCTVNILLQRRCSGIIC